MYHTNDDEYNRAVRIMTAMIAFTYIGMFTLLALVVIGGSWLISWLTGK